MRERIDHTNDLAAIGGLRIVVDRGDVQASPIGADGEVGVMLGWHVEQRKKLAGR